MAGPQQSASGADSATASEDGNHPFPAAAAAAKVAAAKAAAFGLDDCAEVFSASAGRGGVPVSASAGPVSPDLTASAGSPSSEGSKDTAVSREVLLGLLERWKPDRSVPPLCLP